MNITSDKPFTIFKNEDNGRDFYKIGLSKKLENGDYQNGYITCQFRKDVSLDNNTKIYIKTAWLSFYKKDKATIPYIFINEFETIENAINNAKQQDMFSVKEEEIEKSMKLNEIEITDADLPF